MNASPLRVLTITGYFPTIFAPLAVFISAALTFGHPADAVDEFELRQGDRVVMIGDALIEQEQYFGWIEVMMTTQYPDRDVTFRNLGWNADTPAGDSRCGLSLLQAGYEPEGEGWQQLQNQIEKGWTSEEIRQSWMSDIEKFLSIRKKYLIYP